MATKVRSYSKGPRKLIANQPAVHLQLCGDSIAIQWNPIVAGKFTDFPVCVIRYIFIRRLSHLAISSAFVSMNQGMHKSHSSF